MIFFFSGRRRHTRWPRDWSSDVCSSDLRRIANLREMVRAAEGGSAALAELARQIEDVERSIAETDEELLEVVRSAGKLGEQAERTNERLAQARERVAESTLAPEVEAELAERFAAIAPDRKSTRLNSSHVAISY